MTGFDAEVSSVGQHSAPLRVRLRTETAEWHDHVESVADLPGSISTRDEYVSMLSRLYQLHSPLEAELAAPRFRRGWRSVGVEMSVHRRAHLLADDLMGLGATTPTRSPATAPWATFARALGCLYVLEGSALGGRTVAQFVRAAIGEVPMTFLTGNGRSSPSPWLSVCSALTRFEASGGDGDAVVSGACDTFAVFADHLGRYAPSHPTGTVRPR
jgi:heme oxygenase (biliverdin-IX-beta and delta-forming)